MLSNVFFSTISWLSTFVFLVILILAARFLGDEVYGQFAFAFALVALFEITADLGMKDYLVREVARRRDETGRFLLHAATLKVVLCALTAGVLALLALSLDLKPEVRTAIYLLTAAMFCKSFKLTLRGILVAHELFRREMLVVLIDRGLLLAACTTVLLLDARLLPFTWTFLGVSFVNLAITFAATGRSLTRMPGRPEWGRLLALLRCAAPFALTTAAFLIYSRLDSVMLSLMRSDRETGWYNAAYRLTEGMIFIPMVVEYVLFPRLSILHLESREAVQALVRKASRHLVAIGLVITAVGIPLSGPLVALLYGDAYVPAVAALQILLLSLGFMFFTNTLRVVLNAVDRPLLPALGALFGAGVNVVANLFLIPHFGHLGTSLSTVLAEISVMAFLFLQLRRHGYRLGVARAIAKPALALVPTLGLVFWLSHWNFIVLGLLACAVYAAALVALRYFEPDETVAFARVWHRFRGG
jgi:O-antigen/teichoic acid export membrane protein